MMKFITAQVGVALVLAAALVGCASDTTGTDGVGAVEVNLVIEDTNVTSVAFNVTCDSGVDLDGEFNVNDEQDPPVWATIMDLPVGDCTITITASDDNGEPLCTGSADFTVIADQTTKVNLVLTCGVTGDEPRGNVDVDVTFETVVANNCPDLYFFNVVPDEVPAEGSASTVLASDPDGDPLTITLSATGGSFADDSAASTTYTCDGANGAQTVFVSVSDGNPECDKAKSFDVTCPGINPCDGVTCDDTGNECTAAACDQATGGCVVSNVDDGTDCGDNGECENGTCVEADLCADVTCDDTGNECTVGVCNPDTGVCEETNDDGAMCTAGGGSVDLAINGGFETGAFNDGTENASWQQFPGDGSQVITTDNPSEGTFAANLIIPVRVPGDPAVDNVIKNANLGAGSLTPGQAVTVTWDMRGSLSGAGGVVFAELFSELSGGGTSKSELFNNAPIFPTADWQSFTWETTLGPDVSGGVTLQLKVGCGPIEGCGADVFFDNITVVVESEGGGAGMCSGGVCVAEPECVSDGDCGDTGNECTDAVCNAGVCETQDNANACDGGAGTCNAGVCEPNGGGEDLAINGGFETGAFNDGTENASWQQFPGDGSQVITTDNPSEGTFAANLIIPVRVPGDPAVDNVIKNANLGAGSLTPGAAVTVTWDMRGSLSGAGGVVFAELFSELSGGGTSKSELFNNAPIFPTPDWQSFTWNTTLGPDVSGGVTLQLKVGCGPIEGCGADVFFDNVTVVVE